MPVKKPAAKSAAKPLAKKVAAAKKPVKKTAAPKGDSLGQRVASAIVAGEFDGDLALLDDALTERSNEIAATKKTTEAPAKTEKKVAAPPKKSKSASAAIVPEPNKTYGIATTLKSLAGAKVKFLRFKVTPDGPDEKKSVVEMLTDKPGSPKGKKVVIPTSGLIAYTAPRGKK